MAKKKDTEKNWPPNHPAGKGPEPEPANEAAISSKGISLMDKLLVVSGMSRELAGRMVKDGDWPAEAGELARKYGLTQMDAEAVLRVLNVNRGD